MIDLSLKALNILLLVRFSLVELRILFGRVAPFDPPNDINPEIIATLAVLALSWSLP